MSLVILCVDDNHAALTARRVLLSTAGYTVLGAPTGKAALKLFNCNHVDLVITDHLLLDRTGVRLTSEMKRLKPEVPVVLLTAWTDLPPGYDQVDLLLQKCIAPQDFLTEITRLLSTRHGEKTQQDV